MSGSRSRSALVGLVTLAFAAVGVTPAGASMLGTTFQSNPTTTGESTTTQVFFLTADAGQANDVQVTFDPAAQAYTITDAAGIRPHPEFSFADCAQTSPTSAVCTRNDGRSSGTNVGVVFSGRLGDGDDRFAAAGPGKVQVMGGDGADTITGGDADDELEGGTFGESTAADGNDVIDGGAGNDSIGDGSGDDVVRGGAGNDELSGGTGVDIMDGGPGDDDIAPLYDGASERWPVGADRLIGGPGNDLLTVGSNSREVIDAGPGDDVVNAKAETRSGAKESPNPIVCGAGADVVRPGAGDRVSRTCERLEHPEPACSRARCPSELLLLPLSRRVHRGRPLATRRLTLDQSRRNNERARLTISPNRALTGALRRSAKVQVQLRLVGSGLYQHVNPTFFITR